MKLIVGLGNPGLEYKYTRHNIGADFIDFIARRYNLNFVEKFKGLFTDFLHNNEKYFLLKPQTYMNHSGDSVNLAVNFYKLSPESIYIVADDLDIPLGKYKIQIGKYPKSHNGINDVIAKLGYSNIHFVRIGIEARTPSERKLIKGADYVLQKTDFDFSPTFESISQRLFS
ncbi:MAG: peptidyl-tRNA hydrolase [Candidatus Dojkabacteria bacterium]|nr:MAG: peptidyl-tRNA hydrolase [Candidatus Dojkabacteria bacterium]